MADNLRVAMVGAGSFARQHLEAWQQSPDASVVAIWNRSEGKAEKLAGEFQIPMVCADLAEMISRDDVDVVSVSMPHNLHYPICLDAINAGKHVFCEKPLAMTVEEADELWHQSQAMSVKTGIQFIHRTKPSLKRLHQLIGDGYIGQPQYAELKFGMDVARDPATPLIWRFQKSIAGYGVLGDLGVYLIDMARWVFGEIDSVAGEMSTFITERPIISDRYDLYEVLQMYNEGRLPKSDETGEVDNEDECNFMAVFGNGAKGYFRVSRLHEDKGLTFHGSGGVLKCDVLGEQLEGKTEYGGQFSAIDIPQPEATDTIVTQFIGNILHNTDLPPSFHDGLKAQKVMHAVEISSQEKRWVSVAS